MNDFYKDALVSALASLLAKCEAGVRAASGAKQRNYMLGRLSLATELASMLGMDVVAPDPPGKSKVQSKLDPFMAGLGKEPDVAIALKSGVSVATVRKYREKLGIQPFRKALPEGAGRSTAYIKSPPRPNSEPEWRAAIRDRLGVVPDVDLAREVSLTREAVRIYRASLGIPAPPRKVKLTPLPEEARPWFGVLSDAEIARRCGCSTGTVNNWRTRYNLPDSPIWRSTRSVLDDYVHLFGVVTDTEIAKRAGCTGANVVAYRRSRPDLPASPRARTRGRNE